jgi:hypothetical protein
MVVPAQNCSTTAPTESGWSPLLTRILFTMPQRDHCVLGAAAQVNDLAARHGRRQRGVGDVRGEDAWRRGRAGLVGGDATGGVELRLDERYELVRVGGGQRLESLAAADNGEQERLEPDGAGLGERG